MQLAQRNTTVCAATCKTQQFPHRPCKTTPSSLHENGLNEFNPLDMGCPKAKTSFLRRFLPPPREILSLHYVGIMNAARIPNEARDIRLLIHRSTSPWPRRTAFRGGTVVVKCEDGIKKLLKNDDLCTNRYRRTRNAKITVGWSALKSLSLVTIKTREPSSSFGPKAIPSIFSGNAFPAKLN